MMKTGAIILAAGLSSRMGRFKPLLKVAEKTMLDHCIHLFQQGGVDTIIVVAGHGADEIKKAAAGKGAQVVENPYFRQGMFSSIKQGAAAISSCDSFFVLPVDIPLVRLPTLATLAAAFDGRQNLVPTFNGNSGHPPLLSAYMRKKIAQADSGMILRDILAAEGYKKVAVWDAAIICDADTPQGYSALCHTANRRDILQPKEAEILAGQYMSGRLLRHCQSVARMATALTEALPQEADIDLDLVYGAALLHDIARGQTDHEKAGAKLLRHLGLERMAAVVAVHRDLPPPADGKLTEKELVCLADKMVCGSRQVEIAERFQKKLQIYQGDQEVYHAIRRRLHNAEALAMLWKKAVNKS